MSAVDNKSLVRTFFEAVNTGNIDSIRDLVSEDFIEHEEFPGLPNRGPEAPIQALELFRAAFPDLHMAAEETLADGDKVVVRGTMTGTHQGEFAGIPPTNKSFEITFIDIIELRDGKATQHWGVTDQAKMMEQLGLMEM